MTALIEAGGTVGVEIATQIRVDLDGQPMIPDLAHRPCRLLAETPHSWLLGRPGKASRISSESGSRVSPRHPLSQCVRSRHGIITQQVGLRWSGVHSRRARGVLGRGDKEWREVLRASRLRNIDTLSLRFVVSSFRRCGNWFDLDNLVVPVVSIVGAPTLKSVWAMMEVGDVPGVHVDHEVSPRRPDTSLCYALNTPPLSSVRSATRLAEFADAAVFGTDEPVGCEIVLGPAVGPLVWGEFRGPVKSIIDSLWPILGGTAAKQADQDKGPTSPDRCRLRWSGVAIWVP
jgi:hypothetical protein